jgi:hypothetical protein
LITTEIEETMDLASRETAPAAVPIDQDSGEPATEDSLPSPLAEIAAETIAGRNGGNGQAERSTSRRRKPAPRRKRRSTLRPITPGGVSIGTLAGINDDGQPLVLLALDPSSRVMMARTTVPITSAEVDREVVIAFEAGDISRPIVLGILCRPGGPDRAETRTAPPRVRQPIVQATLDGEQLVFTAENEIVLRCGKASLTLTRAGKVLIQGTYLLSRSSGVNRIKGGSVQLN